MGNDQDKFNQLQTAAQKAMQAEGFNEGKRWGAMLCSAMHQMHDFNVILCVNMTEEQVRRENLAAMAHCLAILSAVSSSVQVDISAALTVAANNKQVLFDHLTGTQATPLPVAAAKPAPEVTP